MRRTAAVSIGRLSVDPDEPTTFALDNEDVLPSLAAVEAGETRIRNHLEYFAQHLAEVARPSQLNEPRLSFRDFKALYQRHQHANGCHFVVHQHDHPVSGITKSHFSIL